MKFLNGLLRFIVFIIWAFLVYYIAKALGFSYDPEGTSMIRNIIRVILILIILGGAWFIWRIDFIKKKEKE